MKRIHMLFAALMLLVLAGCIRDSLEVPCAIGGKDNILLVVGKDDGMLTRAANADTESKVTHLDVLISIKREIRYIMNFFRICRTTIHYF